MSIGFGQILIILVVVLVLFGAGKLPTVMGDLGKGLRNFKEGIKGELDDEPKTAEKTEAPKMEDTPDVNSDDSGEA